MPDVLGLTVGLLVGLGRPGSRVASLGNTVGVAPLVFRPPSRSRSDMRRYPRFLAMPNRFPSRIRPAPFRPLTGMPASLLAICARLPASLLEASWSAIGTPLASAAEAAR